ncbi:hypothetical protein M1D69_10090 [Bacillus sp. PK3-037]|nr:hypothetical protein C2H92_06525 [Bacillus halotolerans]
MIAKMMEALDGERFDMVMEKTLKGMTHVMMWGCLPYFLYVIIRLFTN